MKELNDDFLDELRLDFLSEMTFLLDDCEEAYLLLENSSDPIDELLAKVFRSIHSIKGAASALDFNRMSDFAHVLEDYLSILRVHPKLVDKKMTTLLLKANDGFREMVGGINGGGTEIDLVMLKGEIRQTVERLVKIVDKSGLLSEKKDVQLDISGGSAAKTVASTNSVKIDIHKIDQVLDIVGELMIAKGQLLENQEILNCGKESRDLLSVFDKTVQELHEKTFSMQMIPLKHLFLKIQRVTRDISIKLSRPIEFRMNGVFIEIDRKMIEDLNDPLVHLARNAIDHGIESVAVRTKKGKKKKALISLSAKQEGNRVIIEIADDGGGIDQNKIIASAIKKGLVSEDRADSLTNQEVYNFLLIPGFSTASRVTEISGRGVGLDVVKTNIDKMRGHIEIESVLGKGTTFRFSLPLTTTINDGMVVLINDFRYILPLHLIHELVNHSDVRITRLSRNREIIKVHNELLPLMRINDVLDDLNIGEMGGLNLQKYSCENAIKTVVIVKRAGKKYAILVDAALGQTKLVIKPLVKSLKPLRAITGCSIMGDGSVSLVLDIDGILEQLKKRKQIESEGVLVGREAQAA